jgi:diguanylate cyclase (GGDEF)-like protein
MAILLVALNITASQIVDDLALSTVKMYQHPLTVSNAVLIANAEMISMHTHMKDVILARNATSLNVAMTRLKTDEQAVYNHLSVAEEYFLGDLSKIADVRKAFIEWKSIREEVISLVGQNQFSAAAEITSGKGADHVGLLTSRMDRLIEFANAKAKEFLEDSKTKHEAGLTTLHSLTAIICLVSVLISTFVISIIRASEAQLLSQNEEKGKRAGELVLANKELVFQNKEKDKRAAELILANEEKEKRAGELVLANKELAFQNKEKDKRAAELILANEEKAKRAGELVLANKELAFENEEKYSRATELTLANEEKAKLEQIAHYDILTKLPNRSLLADRLSQAMLQCRRRQQSLAVAFLDLDGFKAINDTHGHDVGDEVLITLSLRMKEALREGDTLSRIGGDEFVAILADLTKIEDYEPVIERVLLAASAPVTVGDVVLNVSASIGIALYPQHSNDADILLRHADQAMYVAKESGRNRYQLFDKAQDDAVKVQRETLEVI